ncbi:MAG TPA: hypothetical protein VLE95_03895 [Chlamydiales bacterium]|nr:hypothetical protein [Chlamydiales bacterium]
MQRRNVEVISAAAVPNTLERTDSQEVMEARPATQADFVRSGHLLAISVTAAAAARAEGICPSCNKPRKEIKYMPKDDSLKNEDPNARICGTCYVKSKPTLTIICPECKKQRRVKSLILHRKKDEDRKILLGQNGNPILHCKACYMKDLRTQKSRKLEIER